MARTLHDLLRATLLFVLPTLVVCVATLEVGLRAVGRLPSNVTDGIYEQHGTAYRLRRNITKVSRTPSFSCTIHTNSWGLRDGAPGPRTLGPGPYVAFMGDSITFANGVDYGESFVGVLGALAAPQGVGVVNLAIGGHRFSDQEERLQEFLDVAPRKPAAVVVVFTAQGVATFEQRYEDVFVKDGYIFPRRRWLLPYVAVTLGNASSAYAFFRDGVRRAQAGLLPAGPSVAARDALALFTRGSAWAGPEIPARFEARLARLDERIRGAGAAPVYVYMPSSIDLRWKELLAASGESAERYDLDLYERVLRRHAARAGIRLVDLRPVLQAEHDRGVRLSFAQDSHYNAEANRTIALALRAAFVDDGAPGVALGMGAPVPATGELR